MRRRVLKVLLAFITVKVVACACAVRADDEEARLAYLASRLDERSLPGLAPGAPFDGEWLLVEHSFTIAAATNLAFRHPEQAPARRAEVKRWVDSMVKEDVRAFDRSKWSEDAVASLDGPHGHVGYLGHLSWALGASCLIGNEEHPLAQPVARALRRRFDASPTALIETYPAETYVPDNVVAIAGLSLLDRCRAESSSRQTIARFLDVMRRERLDPKTGVLVFAPGQMGRGSGAGWMAYFLTFIDEDFARTQGAALVREFGVELPFGGFAIREWPRDIERSGDVDSGPLLFGLSPSATGFALAGAAYFSNTEQLHELLVPAEVVGTSVGIGQRRYLFAPLVGDAIVLATRTATPWPKRYLVRAMPSGAVGSAFATVCIVTNATTTAAAARPYARGRCHHAAGPATSPSSRAIAARSFDFTCARGRSSTAAATSTSRFTDRYSPRHAAHPTRCCSTALRCAPSMIPK